MAAGKKYVPQDGDAERVERMVAFGLTHVQIAGIMGINRETLEKHYPEALANGSARCINEVAGNLYRMAIGGGREGVTAAIFYLKTRARWRETNVLEVQELPKIVIE